MLLLPLLGVLGCAHARDRLVDLGEVLEVSIQAGPGMHLAGRITEVVQVGMGSFSGTSYGWKEGLLVMAREQRHEVGVSLLHTYEYRRAVEYGSPLDVNHPRFGDPGYRRYPWSLVQRSDRRLLDVGLSGHLALLGFDLTLRLDELADFVTGLVGFDLLRDDSYVPSLQELRRQAVEGRSPEARNKAFEALRRRGEPTYGYALYTARDTQPRFQRQAVERVKQDLASESAGR
jgi:hypothetical protein